MKENEKDSKYGMQLSNDCGVLSVIKASLWGGCVSKVNENVYEEMKKHAIIGLPANILSSLPLEKELFDIWEKDILAQVSHYFIYKFQQSQLPIDVPYVILKGTAAAQYYPHPEYRIMGDIDIMTSREGFIRACNNLVDSSWRETTNYNAKERGRHRTFEKRGLLVEIHAFFASMNDPVKANMFDDLIVQNINDSHKLPDFVNGLVLLEHINQHLEEGIGLRQIIDWMMFVYRCLPENKWAEFEVLADKMGLKMLAIITTRMCEIYLGLPTHKWCSIADEKLCKELMEYVMKCGNFGNKLNQSELVLVSRVGRLYHPLLMVRELQKMGLQNWPAGKHLVFRPFAWIWQGIKFYKEAPFDMESYLKAKKLNEMLTSLGVKRSKEGLAYYVNNQYKKS